jgi:UDP-N-acetylmuramyl pentapeptide synthase
LHRRTRARGVRVIAVTGSFGKSSTVRLTMAALGLPLNDMVRRNSNGLWAVQRRVLALSDRDSRAVIEIGIDRPGQMARQAAVVAPNVAVVTAVGGEHLETLGSLETIQHEKARLVADVPGRKILVISRVRAGTVDTEPVLREVASMAARLIDQMIVIGDGVEGLVAAACAAGLSPDRVHRAEPGVLDAMRLLRELMRPSDIVLLKARLASKLDRLILGLQGRHVACDLAYCSLFALGCAECAHLGHARRGRLG